MKPQTRALFAGPPPPIVRSTLLYRDEEDGGASTQHIDPALSFRTALTSVSSVLFDRGAAPGRSSPHTTRASDRQTYEPDTIWRNLHRRERALQKELQHLLDVQSVGLAAHLDPNAVPPSTRSDTSEAGSSTPTGGGSQYYSRHNRHVVFDDLHGGEVVIPVRQPRRKPMGLSAARAALARNMALLADLKAEEDAVLTAALGTRKKALAQLRRLAGRREGIVEELKVLEGDGEEPLGRELTELGDERKAVSGEIAELEERLVGLRNRKRWLDGRIADVKNRKEAGLSGYRNALREVDSGVESLLKRPPVKPLDLEVVGGVKREEEGEVGRELEQSPGGVEFLRLRPERRTIEMARDWWESEVKILETRRFEVDKDRNALEEGVQMWRDAVQLVSDFEISLRDEMKGDQPDDPKGKSKVPTPEEAMHAQLGKMGEVMTELEEWLQTAEDRGWNLLICAIGAELEAFREAALMLREALRAAGFGDQDDDGDDGPTPQLGRSMSGKMSPEKRNASLEVNNLVDFHDDTNTAATESDNEVPPDLLVSHEDEHEEDEPEHDQSPVMRRSSASYSVEREDSQSSQSGNEVPPEFLAEHSRDGDVE
jgi:hypothetical protein